MAVIFVSAPSVNSSHRCGTIFVRIWVTRRLAAASIEAMNAQFFADNRERLIDELGRGSYVIGAYTQLQRSGDTAFRFEQEANFWWLSGVEAPDWLLIVDGVRRRSWLVAPEKSQSSQIFDGSLSADDAKKISGVDEVVSADEGQRLLRELAKKHAVVYTLGEAPYAEYVDFGLNPAPKKLYDQLERTFQSVQSCSKELAKLRAIKTEPELRAISRAIDLSVAAFENVRAKLSDLRAEYEIEAEFTHYFRHHGASHAYDPIVAAGEGAVTLHYVKNDQRLRARQLVLCDIGARVDGYAADITRTYAYGQPTKFQTSVHQALQRAHAEIIELIAPGVRFDQYQQNVDVIMKRTLHELGLLPDPSDDDRYRRYFPHAVSHGLGVDVHDSLGGYREFQPGMVLTVEPGIYIPEKSLGIRIEDDIAVTTNGHKNLSAKLSTAA